MSSFPIPKCPSDLCFNSSDFTRESFSVDHFLQKHRNKANLERMRDDLGVYLKVLRSAMIDLINKDYTDFVNLSTNLTGLDKAIDNIQTPLGQLKEELMQVQLNLNEAISEVTSLLEKRKQIAEQKRVLNSATKISSSLRKLTAALSAAEFSDQSLVTISGQSLARMQRAVSDYSHIKFHLARCQNLLMPAEKLRSDQLGQKLTNLVDNHFISCLLQQQYQNLPQLLGMYLTLGRARDAEELYRRQVVAPAMAKLINEEALASQPRGLQGLYDALLLFINEHMKPLLSLTAYSPSPSTNRCGPPIKGFEFIVHSYWPEVEQRLEMHLSSIYAPGNPQLFFQRYTESLNFLSKLEKSCSNSETVNLLKNHPNYSSFLHRWNLPVYFQIRFQEIAGKLESVIEESESEMKSASERERCFQLAVSETAWQCLHLCWEEKVFIPQLAHRFWKLSLQILARYNVWSGSILDKKQAVCDDNDVDNLVRLYADLEAFCKRLPEFLGMVNGVFASHFSLSSKIKDHMKSNVDECSAVLEGVRRSDVRARACALVVSACVQALKQVGEVPRLFRRTNRHAPSSPSPYVTALLAPAVRFHSSPHPIAEARAWTANIFAQVTKQYYTSVCDVLTSVQKTEESLRRLKKIRERSGADKNDAERNALTAERNASRDDDKIRLQLHLDVNSYCEQVESLNIEGHGNEQLQSLRNLVQMTQARNVEMK